MLSFRQTGVNAGVRIIAKERNEARTRKLKELGSCCVTCVKLEGPDRLKS